MTENKSIDEQNQIRRLADIEVRLQYWERYVSDIKFLRTQLTVLTRRLGPMQRLVDAAITMHETLEAAEKEYIAEGHDIVRVALPEREEFLRCVEELIAVTGRPE